MVDYIIKYQNSYVFSCLFNNNMIDLLKKGVRMTELLNSEIFNRAFDYDEWSSTSIDDNKVLRPYNKSMFKLRYEYSNVFRAQFDKE